MNPSLSSYRYGSSFRFVGDYLDTKPLDAMGRRKTRIVAIDALDCPTKLQYETNGLLRYVLFLFHFSVPPYVVIYWQHVLSCQYNFSFSLKWFHR
jgi:hypothetical protein